MFNALVLDTADDALEASVRALEQDQLPDGEVVVSIAYSSLNYKDGLAVTGKGDIIRGDYPFVPGIDLAGTVERSSSPAYQPGDQVVGTGWGLGEETWGGFSQKQRVDADGLVPLPERLSLKQAMIIGTAGFTAMLSVLALDEHDVTPERGEVVVTGASGGVGSFATALLGTLGYDAVASTGSAEAHDYLRELGACRFIDRGELGNGPKRPLDSVRWAGGVDAVGGDTLAALLSQTGRRGAVASCGLAGGHKLNTTVFPFILRGVSLLGIDSNKCPQPRRREAWRRLAQDLPTSTLERILSDVVPLGGVPEVSEQLLRGEGRGRVVVDVQA